MPSSRTTSLLRNVISQLRKRANVTTLSDSTGASVTGRETLVRALVLRRLLRREAAPEELNIGVLLPPSVAAAITNLALALDRRVAVNLNYSLSEDLLHFSIAESGLRHVITSRAFLERMPIELSGVEVIILEELAPRATWLDKAAAAILSFLPLSVLERILGIQDIPEDDLMTIIFTSGSTGRPKGVMLPWRSIDANTGMVDALLRLRPDDVMLGVLPFFHTFGYTITLWTMLAMGVGAVYHTNPLEGRVIGRLIRERGVTIVLGTPTLLRAYVRRLPPEDFASVEIVADRVGAAADRRSPTPSKPSSASAPSRAMARPNWDRSSRPMCPPLAPRAIRPAGCAKAPSAGRHAACASRCAIPRRGRCWLQANAGVLWVTGPHVMLGYLNRPDLTEQVIDDGWYNTGDVVTIDEDGFITIVGRESRFAKIGGEQVPFAVIEEALATLTGGSEDGAPRAVVTAVPDDATGERLVVVHTELEESPEQLIKGMVDARLPRLFIPSPADFHEIETMPLIGIGKVDLEAINRVAREASERRSRAKA